MWRNCSHHNGCGVDDLGPSLRSKRYFQARQSGKDALPIPWITVTVHSIPSTERYLPGLAAPLRHFALAAIGLGVQDPPNFLLEIFGAPDERDWDLAYAHATPITEP